MLGQAMYCLIMSDQTSSAGAATQPSGDPELLLGRVATYRAQGTPMPARAFGPRGEGVHAHAGPPGRVRRPLQPLFAI
ncbi:hypothetical protein SAMN05216456_1988 [Devosia crocina]|uniref:Uncharacterized protein n=1 Tax=Devosia crocina TaxID=429728 RepID=A0A1I7NJE3_9HYPH|nr:hypothetical protein SAMN05216456_1988 [Devosia crocina]